MKRKHAKKEKYKNRNQSIVTQLCNITLKLEFVQVRCHKQAYQTVLCYLNLFVVTKCEDYIILCSFRFIYIDSKDISITK